MTKRMLLAGLQSIGKQYGLKWLYFIPSTLYGPDFDLDDNHFIFDLIRNCHNAKNKDAPFTIWGDGNQRRELVYVTDAVSTMLSLLKEENQIFNIASGKDYSINEFAKKVCEIIGYDYNKLNRDLNKYVGVKEKLISVKKTEEAINKQGITAPRTSLEEGLVTTINYFTNNIK